MESLALYKNMSPKDIAVRGLAVVSLAASVLACKSPTVNSASIEVNVVPGRNIPALNITTRNADGSIDVSKLEPFASSSRVVVGIENRSTHCETDPTTGFWTCR